jgi:hypothetical protein
VSADNPASATATQGGVDKGLNWPMRGEKHTNWWVRGCGPSRRRAVRRGVIRREGAHRAHRVDLLIDRLTLSSISRREGGMRVTAFISGGYLPKTSRGTTSDVIFHIADVR